MKQKLYDYVYPVLIMLPTAATFYFTLTAILPYSFEYRIGFKDAIGYSALPSLLVLILMVKFISFLEKKFGK
jgi:hypothetical protein